MMPETRALLLEFYRPCMDDLSALLNDTRYSQWTRE